MPDDKLAPPVPRSVPGVPPPPPVPAAVVPPPVPPAQDAADEVAAFADGISVSRVRVTHRHRPARAAAALGTSTLVTVVAALALYVAWPQLQKVLKTARRPDPAATRGPNPVAATSPLPDETPEPNPATPPLPEQRSAPRPKPEPKPKPKPKPTPGPTPMPTPPETAAPEPAAPEPEQPAVDVDKARALVGAAVTKAFDALRQRDFAAAKRELAAVAEPALDDQQATDRLQRWRQLTEYAEAYPKYRDKALASAASTGATYDLGERQIAVVEFTPRQFVYRDSRNPGRNLRAPGDAIPPDVEAVIVGQWFSKGGQAANHLFLGAAAIARREPDLGAARREWQAAADGGEPQGSLLLGILDDPAVRGR